MAIKFKLLVLDGSVTVQKLVHLTFADTEFAIVAAHDAADVLQKIKSLKPPPTILFVDLQNLKQLWKDVKKARPEMKIVLFHSGAELPPENISIDGLLKKPFDSRDLKDLTKSLLDPKSQSSKQTVSKVLARSKKEFSHQQWAPDVTESTVIRPNESAVATESREVSHDQTADRTFVLEQAFESVMEEPTDRTSTVTGVEMSERSATLVAVGEPDDQTPVEGSGRTGGTGTLADTTPSQISTIEMEAIARDEVRRWIETNLPSLAQKMIREEIEKQVSKLS